MHLLPTIARLLHTVHVVSDAVLHMHVRMHAR